MRLYGALAAIPPPKNRFNAEGKQIVENWIPVEVPKRPTHALRLTEQGEEGSIIYVFAFKVADEYFDWDNGKSLLTYDGDDNFTAWELN